MSLEEKRDLYIRYLNFVKKEDQSWDSDYTWPRLWLRDFTQETSKQVLREQISRFEKSMLKVFEDPDLEARCFKYTTLEAFISIERKRKIKEILGSK